MAHSPEPLSQWVQSVSTHLPHLSKPQATVLALYSFGMIVAQSCGRSSVALVLAELLGQSAGTLRERLRDWCRDTADKPGAHRREVEVPRCFTPLLQWVLRWWVADERRLALALDATTLGQRFTVLALSVVCHGCAIPVAWVVLPATAPGAWKPHWCGLLEQMRPRLPKGWTVILLTDRGLWARWLYCKIVALGWHPYMRINDQGNYRPQSAKRWRALRDVVRRPDTHWCSAVTCFSKAPARLECTLLACWEPGHAEAWLILTDLEPENADALWYGARGWIECAFKDSKRGGLHWEQTKMTDPARATRLWLAIAVAMLCSVAIGAQAESQLPASGFAALPRAHIARRMARRAAQRRRAQGTCQTRGRELSLFRRGLLTLLARLICGLPLPRARFRSFTRPGEYEKTYP